MGTKKFVTVGNRVIGEVIGDTFVKVIQGSRHLLKNPPAVALSVESLEQAAALGATVIEITDSESGRVYRSTVENFQQYSFKVQRGGFEPQLGMRLERFDMVAPSRSTSRQPEPKRTAQRQETWLQTTMEGG